MIDVIGFIGKPPGLYLVIAVSLVIFCCIVTSFCQCLANTKKVCSGFYKCCCYCRSSNKVIKKQNISTI